MKKSAKDKAEGKFHEVRGKVKEKVGQVMNNPNLETEGQGEKIGGKVQKRIGQVEKVLEQLGDGLADAPWSAKDLKRTVFYGSENG
jgi:uncharacterized protein YjbJ (UPF0337 family)